MFQWNIDLAEAPSQFTKHVSIPVPNLVCFAIRSVEGGERAVTRFEEGVAGYETRSFRGLGVFSSTPVSLRLSSHIHCMLHARALCLGGETTVPADGPACLCSAF
jgi:hypothetical protein